MLRPSGSELRSKSNTVPDVVIWDGDRYVLIKVDQKSAPLFDECAKDRKMLRWNECLLIDK